MEEEGHCVILTRAILHSRWEVEVLPEHIDSGPLEGLAARLAAT